MMNKIVTIGWSTDFIRNLALDVSEHTVANFTHVFWGNPDSKINVDVINELPSFKIMDNRLFCRNAITSEIEKLVTQIEVASGRSLRMMIQGDRSLRKLSSEVSYRYACNMAKCIFEILNAEQPVCVLSTNDNLDSSLAMSICKYLQIPWFAMNYTAIPQGYTWFIDDLRAGSIFAEPRDLGEAEIVHLRSVMNDVRNEKNIVLALNQNIGLLAYLRDKLHRVLNFIFKNRLLYSENPPRNHIKERILSVVHEHLRRASNRFFNNYRNMISKPFDEKFVLIPLHMVPESTIDVWEPNYFDQLSLIYQIAINTPSDIAVYIKLHKSDIDNYSAQQLKRITRLHNVKIVHPGANTMQFIKKCYCLIGINGTPCLEAALIGRPVFMFGSSPYIDFPSVEKVASIESLHQQLREINSKESVLESEIFEAFKRYIARYRPGTLNSWGPKKNKEDLIKVGKIFDELLQIL
jgi:hypothetical protein